MRDLGKYQPSTKDTMYITIRFGNNETLLCNPSCAIVNLLASIKRRTGYGNTDVCLDLSDETGLVKDLDHHKYDYATKLLNTHATYILLEKQLATCDVLHADVTTDADGRSTPASPNYTYVPLLDRCQEHFPGFQLHVAQTEKKKSRNLSKSPSPAGIRGSKPCKNKGPLNRASSKRR